MKRNPSLDNLQMELILAKIETEKMKQKSMKDAWDLVNKLED